MSRSSLVKARLSFSRSFSSNTSCHSFSSPFTILEAYFCCVVTSGVLNLSKTKGFSVVGFTSIPFVLQNSKAWTSSDKKYDLREIDTNDRRYAISTLLSHLSVDRLKSDCMYSCVLASHFLPFIVLVKTLKATRIVVSSTTVFFHSRYASHISPTVISGSGCLAPGI